MAIALAAALLSFSCMSWAPWKDEPVGQEVNLVFVVRNNLLFLPSATIDGREGRFFFGSAAQNSVLDSKFAATLSPSREHSVRIGQKQVALITPVSVDLAGAGDAIIGADVGAQQAVTIDYHSGLVTFQKEGIHPEMMTIFAFDGPPQIDVAIAGKQVRAIVDTALPDTLILPSERVSRGKVQVSVAGTNFGLVDVRWGGPTEARIGNRLLSRFLVTIDYGRREVGLWRDPRIPL